MDFNRESRKIRLDVPTYPGVPQAVAIIPLSSILDNPKSDIIIFESSSAE